MAIQREQLGQIDFSDVADGTDLMPPVIPGEILRGDFMEPLGLSANALAKALHVPPNRITAILNGTRSITADTALRLARYFNTTPRSWLNLLVYNRRSPYPPGRGPRLWLGTRG